MKAGILTQILVCKIAGTHSIKFAQTARELGFKMFAHNGFVYSVNEVLGSGNEIPGTINKIEPLFKLSDLVDCTFNG